MEEEFRKVDRRPENSVRKGLSCLPGTAVGLFGSSSLIAPVSFTHVGETVGRLRSNAVENSPSRTLLQTAEVPVGAEPVAE